MKKLLWVLIGLALLLAVSGAILIMGKQPDPFPADSASAARLRPGPHPVAHYTQEFSDPARPTAANGDYPGASGRTLDCDIWHPTERGGAAFPLIVYSHGFSSNKEEGAYLAEHLASLGYVVVAPTFPLTHFHAPGGPEVKDVVNQPGDVSFLIDTLLEQSATPGHPLEGMIDGSRIGVAGLSLGGMTTALVSYHPTLRDPRVAAALSIAGPTAIFTRRFFTHAELPFLMLAGDIDALVPYATNGAPVPDKVPGGELVTIAGASHTGFGGPAAPLRWLSNPDAIGCWIVQRNFSDGAQDRWFDLIGSEAQGIDHNAVDELCLTDPLPPALNVLRQQRISQVVVGSFFQSVFAGDPAEREAAARFLRQTLPAELAEVSYRRDLGDR